MAERTNGYDIAVIGAGIMGSAAARHAATRGARVVLIGPAEPENKASHSGVFASHYDQARISRKLDKDPDWSRLTQMSIDRYAELSAAGNKAFFAPVGSIMVGAEHGPRAAFIQNARNVGESHQIAHQQLRKPDLDARFPFFDFPDGMLALYEQKTGGWINPRDCITAQITASQRLGASVIRQEARALAETADGVVITCADGRKVTSAKSIVACGAFSKADGVLPLPIPMKVYARTVAFFELPATEAARLASMPSVVYVSGDPGCNPYILPPVRYSDGKTYLKIGGDPHDVELETTQDIKAWFRGRGDEAVGSQLCEQLLRLMPDLGYSSVSFGSCVTSYTASGKPLIYPQTDRIIVLTGGNGAAAKCGDELGRLAACLALEGDISDEGYRTDFRP